MRRILTARGRESRPYSAWRRFLDLVLAGAFIGLVALVAARFERLAMRQEAGVATVNDGDSLTIGAARIRLRGIDAPELDQICQAAGRNYPCGRRSKDALAVLTRDGRIACEGWERDRFDRLLAVCTAGGRDLNLAQVEGGWALAFGDYAAAEEKAREARLGLWAGSFDPPRDWRERHGAAGEMEHGLLQGLLGLLREMFRF